MSAELAGCMLLHIELATLQQAKVMLELLVVASAGLSNVLPARDRQKGLCSHVKGCMVSFDYVQKNDPIPLPGCRMRAVTRQGLRPAANNFWHLQGGERAG